MSRWFRHYVGMMRDDKLVRVAVRAKQPVERVLWVYGAILESASEINDGGRYEFDAGEAAYFLRCDESELLDIHAALVSLGRISDRVVERWGDRQFDSDKSKDRQKRYRERQQAARERDCDVTRPSRDGGVTPQETDTETDSYTADACAGDVSARMPELYAALGVTDETKSPGLLTFSEPMRWVSAGCDIDLDILPALRSIAARGRTVKSWAYCSDAVFEARDRRLAPAPAVQSRPGTSPPLPRKPRNAGEAARLELIRRGEYPDATSYLTGPENQSDRNTGFAGTDIARRIALAAGG